MPRSPSAFGWCEIVFPDTSQDGTCYEDIEGFPVLLVSEYSDRVEMPILFSMWSKFVVAVINWRSEEVCMI